MAERLRVVQATGALTTERDSTDAANRGDTAAVVRLLEGGADPTTMLYAHYSCDDGGGGGAVSCGSTVLLGAAAHRRLEVVRLLMKHGADLEVVQLLLEGDADQKCSADLSLACIDGVTPLMVAAWGGHLEALRLLLRRGAALDAVVPSTGGTAFHGACNGNQPECAEALMRAGCDVSLKDLEGLTGWEVAEGKDHAKVVARLRVALAETTLVISAEKGDAAVVARLLAEGADPNTWVQRCQPMAGVVEPPTGRAVTHTSSTTALVAAAHCGQLEVARLLMDGGADPSRPTGDGDTPLMLAAGHGRLEVLQLLLARGANLDMAHGMQGTTAFHFACFGNQPDCVAALVLAGCDVGLKDSGGETGREIAERLGHTTVVAWLRPVEVSKAKALSDHKDAEYKAMSKHEQMRLRAKVKKLARQEKWKQKAAKEEGDRWGSGALLGRFATERMQMTSEQLMAHLSTVDAEEHARVLQELEDFTPALMERIAEERVSMTDEQYTAHFNAVTILVQEQLQELQYVSTAPAPAPSSLPMRTKRLFPVTVEAMVEGIDGPVDSDLEMPDLPMPEDVEPNKEDLEVDKEAPEEKLAEQPSYTVAYQDPVQVGFCMDAMGGMLPQPPYPGSSTTLPPPPPPIPPSFHPQQHSYEMMSQPVSPYDSPPHGCAAFMGQQMMFQPGDDFGANGMYGYSAFPQANHHHQLFSVAEPAAPPTWKDFRGQVYVAVTSWHGGAAEVVKMYTAGSDSERQEVLTELTGDLWRLASTHGGALLLKRMVMRSRGKGAIPPVLRTPLVTI
jgi:ankyrin repeat protein